MLGAEHGEGEGGRAQGIVTGNADALVAEADVQVFGQGGRIYGGHVAWILTWVWMGVDG